MSDVDGDGGDDIIVGAPMYHEYSKNNDSYETGKVYVYLKKEVLLITINLKVQFYFIQKINYFI